MLAVSAVAVLLTTANAALVHPKPIVNRRDCIMLGAVILCPSGRVSASWANGVAEARTPNFDFGIATESGRPYIHYLENADKLARHLVSFADGVDLSVGDSLEEEITAFAATYLPRKTDGGPLPGIGQLMASCDALSSHLAVYRGRDAAPLPAARADTVRAKALAAQKRIQKVQAARRAAAGAWPSCRGVPLGTRDTQCSTEDF